MAHSKRRRTPYRSQRTKTLSEKNKENRKERWEKLRKKWAEDKEYQQKQAERLKRLESKSGRARNIEEGILAKERAKKLKAEKKRLAEIQKKKRWHRK